MISLKHLNQNKVLLFRVIALTEGTSYLILLFIGMPLKYYLGFFAINKMIGTIHGLLTIFFCILLFNLWRKKTLDTKFSLYIFIASLIPFGAFIADSYIKKTKTSKQGFKSNKKNDLL